MGKKKNKKNITEKEIDSQRFVAVGSAEESQQDALREAVEAARESAVVLREAASVLSAASMPRWNSYPSLMGPAGMVDAGMNTRPPLYTEGVLVESAQGAPSLTIKSNILDTGSSTNRSVTASAKQTTGSSSNQSAVVNIEQPVMASTNQSAVASNKQTAMPNVEQVSVKQTTMSSINQPTVVNTEQPAVASTEQTRTENMREFVRYKPKEPSSGGSRFGGKRASDSNSGSNNGSRASVLSGLPKFGEAPDPLPEPDEILASVPSLTTLGMISPGTSVVKPSDIKGNTDTANGSSSSSLSSQIKPLSRSDSLSGTTSGSSASVELDQQGQIPMQPEDSLPFDSSQAVSSAAETVQLHIGEELPMEYDPRNQAPIQDGMYDQTMDYTQQYAQQQYAQQQYMGDSQNPYGQMQYDGYYQQYDPDNAYDYDPNYVVYDGANPYAAPPVKNGKATVSLILGVLSILLALIPPVGIILGIVALLLSKSYIKAGGMAPRAGTGRVCGFAGLILSLILLVAYAVFIAYFVGGLYGSANAGAIMGYLQTTFLAQFL